MANEYVPKHTAPDVRAALTECMQALSGGATPGSRKPRRPLNEQGLNVGTFPSVMQPIPPPDAGSEYVPQAPVDEYTDMSDAELGGLFRNAQAQSLDDFIPGTGQPMSGFGEATESEAGEFEFMETEDGTFAKVWNAPNGKTYLVQPLSEDLDEAGLDEDELDEQDYEDDEDEDDEDEDDEEEDEEDMGESTDYTEALEDALLDMLEAKRGKKKAVRAGTMPALRSRGDVKDPEKVGGYLRWFRHSPAFSGKTKGRRFAPKAKKESLTVDQLANLTEAQYAGVMDVLNESRRARGLDVEPKEATDFALIDGFPLIEDEDGGRFVAVPEADFQQMLSESDAELEAQAAGLPDGALEDLRLEAALERVREGGSVSEALSTVVGSPDLSDYDTIEEGDETYVVVPLEEYSERFAAEDDLTEDEDLDEDEFDEDFEDELDEDEMDERALRMGRRMLSGRRIKGGKAVMQRARTIKRKTGKARMTAIRNLMRARRGSGRMKALRSKRRGARMGLYGR